MAYILAKKHHRQLNKNWLTSILKINLVDGWLTVVDDTIFHGLYTRYNHVNQNHLKKELVDHRRLRQLAPLSIRGLLVDGG